VCYGELSRVVDMTDKSSYTIEEQLVVSVWVHERLNALQTTADDSVLGMI
jgi:hypothetical protein